MPADRLTPQEFVAKWRQSTLKERSSYQEHFIDLCRLLGHPTPAEIDSSGVFFTFEAGASKQTGEQGWADVWLNPPGASETELKKRTLTNLYNQRPTWLHWHKPVFDTLDFDLFAAQGVTATKGARGTRRDRSVLGRGGLNRRRERHSHRSKYRTTTPFCFTA
jgi:hypothetical protein